MPIRTRSTRNAKDNEKGNAGERLACRRHGEKATSPMSNILNAFRSFMQQGGGGLLLPEDDGSCFSPWASSSPIIFWKARDKYFKRVDGDARRNLQRHLPLAVAAGRGERAGDRVQQLSFSGPVLPVFFGLHLPDCDSARDQFFSVRYLQIEDENHGEYYAADSVSRRLA